MKTVLFLSEIDIPYVEVRLDKSIVANNLLINKNQLIQADIIYDSSYNVDTLSFSGAILY